MIFHLLLYNKLHYAITNRHNHQIFNHVQILQLILFILINHISSERHFSEIHVMNQNTIIIILGFSYLAILLTC